MSLADLMAQLSPEMKLKVQQLMDEQVKLNVDKLVAEKAKSIKEQI